MMLVVMLREHRTYSEKESQRVHIIKLVAQSNRIHLISLRNQAIGNQGWDIRAEEYFDERVDAD
jgi:hypothetical protein